MFTLLLELNVIMVMVYCFI